MKYFFVLILLLTMACSEEKSKSEQDVLEKQFLKKDNFDVILEESQTEGSILIYDLKNNIYYSNDFEWAKVNRLPASTFKIPNSLIGLETGVVDADTTIFKWNGEKRYLSVWEQDQNLKEAFHNSCVPCYQEMARKIGAEKMNNYLQKSEYGNMLIDSNNIDKFWLEGDFGISQFGQIEFLKKLYYNKLPLSEKTQNIMKEIMIAYDIPNEILRAKTGWAIRNGNNNGWYVGYIDMDTNAYFFAININPKNDFNMSMFPQIRKDIAFRALKEMGIIE